MESEVKVEYAKVKGANKVVVTIESDQPLDMLDALRALAGVVSNILYTGKY
jgi:hypothetical protein